MRAVKLSLGVVDRQGNERCRFEGFEEVVLSWRGAFHEGDRIVVTCDRDAARVALKLDAALPESLVLLKGGVFEFPVPVDETHRDYARGVAFAGERHWCYVRVPDSRECAAWRNVAHNAYDRPLPGGVSPCAFPHASTNVAGANSQFYAKNAIDGVFEARGHGSWPHESWGTTGSDEPWLRVEFGESVRMDELRLYLRADYPHDTWWHRAHVCFSQGEPLDIALCQTAGAQRFDLQGRTASWIEVRPYGKDDPAGYAAISQLMVMGATKEALHG